MIVCSISLSCSAILPKVKVRLQHSFIMFTFVLSWKESRQSEESVQVRRVQVFFGVAGKAKPPHEETRERAGALVPPLRL